jgi:hypothetical protein
MGNFYVLHGIKTPSYFYSQVEDATPNAQAQALLGMCAGWHQPMFRGVRSLSPEITWRTTNLYTALLECGLVGKDNSAGNTDLYYRQATNLGTRVAEGTASHMQLRMAKAFQYIKSISARHQQEATAEMHTVGLYDGSNVPIVATGSVALSGTTAPVGWYGLGPVSINGTAIDGVEEMTIDFGVELMRRGQNSEAYERYCLVKSINPVITLRGTTLEGWTTYGPVGVALNGSSGFTGYLRKVNTDAQAIAYFADVTVAHPKFVGAYGTVRVESTGGGGNSEAVTGLRIELRAPDTSHDCLSITPASAIT